MNVIDLETPASTEKYYAPKTDNEYPFYINEYGRTFDGTPCYQLRVKSPLACVQYVVSGGGIIMCNNKLYTVSAGDTFLLLEGSDHIYYSNPDNHFERIWINFKGELSRTLIKMYGIEENVVFKGVSTLEILEKIQASCKELVNDAEEYKNKTACLFLELVQLLAKNKSSVCNPTSEIEQIRLYVEHHITENIKISDIAEEFSFSSEHIIRIFKKNYGITPHRFILQSKIRLAMIMLMNTDNSVEYIANSLNFSDPKHFSTQFKRTVGCKPSEYRKKLSER